LHHLEDSALALLLLLVALLLSRQLQTRTVWSLATQPLRQHDFNSASHGTVLLL
jgi:hypothetical protein